MQHRLYHGSDGYAWHSRPWPEVQSMAGRVPLIVLPIYSMTDWGMGRPLDAEEVLGSAVLEEALAGVNGSLAIRVLPPFRFVPRFSAATCFGVDAEVAHQALEDTIRSAAASGVRRFVLLNTSPLLEDWVDVAARDLRVGHDLQLFCANLSGVGLDFHPERAVTRSGIDAALTLLLGTGGEAFSSEGSGTLTIDPLPALAGAAPPALQAEAAGGETILKIAAGHLARLLQEIEAHTPPSVRLPDVKGSA